MQWMTTTFYVPCCALRAPQHVAVSLFGPLNQSVISSASSVETVFACLYKGISTQVLVWSFHLLEELPMKAESSMHPFLGFVWRPTNSKMS